MSFDPNDPNLLTAEKKLFNIKKKLNLFSRQFKEIEMSLVTPHEVVKILHIVSVALKEIENEVDRTV